MSANPDVANAEAYFKMRSFSRASSKAKSCHSGAPPEGTSE
jgi:hypothetical protein